MALNFPGPTVRLSLAYSPPLSHETSRHAVHLFSSTVFFNSAGFFHSLPSPPSLCPSVCLCVYPPRLLLPYEPTPSPSMTTPPPPPPAASRPLPHLARRVPHECQAGIQGVCRRASLTGSAGAAAGRPSCPDSPGSQRHKHAVLIGWSRPAPLLTGAGCPIRSLRRVGGGLWRAVTCGMRSSLVFVLQCHHLSYWCWYWSIRPSMCGSCTNIYCPPVFIFYPSC